MSELLKGIERAQPPTPRDSALGVIVRRRADGWHVLLGKRSRQSRFMPGHLAFPGGNLDPVDRPDEPGALARCVAREVAEETGIEIPPDSWFAAGARITPPMFPVRFNARFFVAEAPDDGAVPETSPSPDEIESMGFENPADVTGRWALGEALVPPPVLPVLRVLSATRVGEVREFADLLRQVNDREQDRTRMEFVPDIWALPMETRTLPPATHTNVWMPGGESFAIVDPGSDERGEIDFLLRVVDRRAKLGTKPAAVLLTHHHQDHTAGAAVVAAEVGVPVRGHAATLERVDPGGVETIAIEDDELIDLHGMTLRAAHTPGHAVGHLVFHVPEREALIAGDLLSGMSTVVIDPDGGDMGAYLDSLRRVATIGCRTVLPAHGPPLPARAIEKTIQHRLGREKKVLGALSTDGPVSLAVVTRAAYSDTPDAPAVLKEMQALAHLVHLESEGRACRADPEGRSWSP
jgi:glyoxylase-like metal-dependent hydrolase (beta-lactamase superfamily II)/8-oxo-dGTP pyrophosphatase MutT (NUDIX family)